jgi:hypothetical protein
VTNYISLNRSEVCPISRALSGWRAKKDARKDSKRDSKRDEKKDEKKGEKPTVAAGGG